MYQIEKLQENKFYIKATGTFPPPVAERFVKEFNELTKNAKNDLSIIVDITDAILLKFDSIEIILDLFKKNNTKLYRSAFIIANNPPLSKEIKYIIDKAASPNRKIVSSLDEAKQWIGIEDVIIKKKE
ncbi:MAG: hypothetical protein KGD73_10065 [Candidatus Lokiarchaeota archaeon]|nr:hypothetical protein [Candidatus Lokiarchaeota archaeon]